MDLADFIEREAERILSNLDRRSAVEQAATIIRDIATSLKRASFDMSLRSFREGGRGDVKDVYVIHPRGEPDILITLEHYVEYGFDEAPLRILLAPQLRNGVEIIQEVETDVAEKISLEMIREVVQGVAVDRGGIINDEVVDFANQVVERLKGREVKRDVD